MNRQTRLAKVEERKCNTDFWTMPGRTKKLYQRMLAKMVRRFWQKEVKRNV